MFFWLSFLDVCHRHNNSDLLYYSLGCRSNWHQRVFCSYWGTSRSVSEINLFSGPGWEMINSHLGNCSLPEMRLSEIFIQDALKQHKSVLEPLSMCCVWHVRISENIFLLLIGGFELNPVSWTSNITIYMHKMTFYDSLAVDESVQFQAQNFILRAS